MHRLTLHCAFMRTLPVLCGYVFLGLAFGLLLQSQGYDWRWALLISTTVYAGSMQFVMLGFLGSGISLVSVALMTLSVNCRHIFYGLSMLSCYKGMGAALPYMVFSLTDETYSLQVSPEPMPEGVPEKQARFLISFLDQLYWVVGSLLGAALGQVLPFDLTGIDFAMTACSWSSLSISGVPRARTCLPWSARRARSHPSCSLARTAFCCLHCARRARCSCACKRPSTKRRR